MLELKLELTKDLRSGAVLRKRMLRDITRNRSSRNRKRLERKFKRNKILTQESDLLLSTTNSWLSISNKVVCALGTDILIENS